MGEFNTTLKITNTTKEDIEKIFNTLKSNTNQKQRTYVDDFITIRLKSQCEEYSDKINKIIKYIQKNIDDFDNEEILANISGPLGWVDIDDLSKLGYVFLILAEATPGATFSGKVSGFSGNADVECKCELKDGLLYLSDTNIEIDSICELYAKEFKKKLSRIKFCKIFNVDKDEFDSECYDDFIAHFCTCGIGLDEMWFDFFMECCEYAEIDEEEFEEAIDKIKDLGIPDYYSFREQYEENSTKKAIYNPVTKEFIKK